jgi:hypothetical protein
MKQQLATRFGMAPPDSLEFMFQRRKKSSAIDLVEVLVGTFQIYHNHQYYYGIEQMILSLKWNTWTPMARD